MTVQSRIREGLASLVRLLCWLATAAVLAGQLGRWSPAFDLLNALLLPILLLLVPLLALTIYWHERFAAIVAVVGLLIGTAQLFGLSLPADDNAADSAARLRIVTLSTWRDNPDPEAIRKVIAAQAPDIVMFQESDGTAARVVDALLPDFARVKPCKAKYCSLTILSRWPARRVAVPAGTRGPLPDVVIAEVEAPFGTFRVINLHLPRPGDARTPLFFKRITALARLEAAGPVLVGGDFNLGSGTFNLRQFAQMSGLRRLDGFVPTYPAHLPLPAFVGIDHILASRDWSGAKCHRTGAGGSDHYGLACDVNLRPDQSDGALGK